ncbi:NUDIX hydrolase [Proteinivorax hydrogeniformans]|uniref:NUDIX hydrolase n=1 Tax=Proteinivorax hydrogeniformans TaxID=1826727 RepID=A0AAU8HRE2_9FIRM
MNWKTVSKEYIHKSNFLNLILDTSIHPTLGKHQFYRINLSNWVNVVAINKDGDFILVKQFRHGTKKITYEVPAGAIDKGEEPKSAAIRELTEETGYTGNPIYLGKVEVNPAILSNYCYFYLVLDCELVSKQCLDATEDIKVLHLKKERVKQMLASEEINHSLVSLALYKAFDFLQKK